MFESGDFITLLIYLLLADHNLFMAQQGGNKMYRSAAGFFEPRNTFPFTAIVLSEL